MGFYEFNTLANPAHDVYGHAVAQCLVTGAVGAFAGGFAAPGDGGVIVGKALQPLALARGEAADGGGAERVGDGVLAALVEGEHHVAANAKAVLVLATGGVLDGDSNGQRVGNSIKNESRILRFPAAARVLRDAGRDIRLNDIAYRRRGKGGNQTISSVHVCTRWPVAGAASAKRVHRRNDSPGVGVLAVESTAVVCAVANTTADFRHNSPS